MNVVVNGEPREVDAGCSLASLIAELTGARTGIAVAVNGAVRPRGTHAEVRLVAGDRIEIVTAVQGG